jgi:hypothetical protein
MREAYEEVTLDGKREVGGPQRMIQAAYLH